MGSRQREPSGIVIEGRRVPVGRRMALRTIMVEVPGDVVRVRRPLEIRLMALEAIGICKMVVAVGVAGLTLHRNVPPCQREPRRIVIESCCIPGGGGVTLRTIVAEVPGSMIRIERGRKDILMATEAVRRPAGKDIVSMAARALQSHMSAREWETGQGRVIVSCPRPA